MNVFLEPNAFVDSDHPRVVAYAELHAHEDPVEAAKRLYLAVRDGFPYNPWNVYFDTEHYRASAVLERGPEHGAHCIDKALLLAAGARVLGIPSRLHYADVRNHLGTADLERRLGSDLLVFHGYTELYLRDRWVAATPAFNRGLCVKLGVEPLEFDGLEDSVFQAYDRQAGRFMEYVTDHGSFAGVPFDAMLAAWKQHYGATRDAGWPRR